MERANYVWNLSPLSGSAERDVNLTLPPFPAVTGCLSGLSSFIIILTDEWDFMSHMALVSCELMSLHTCENLLLFLFISLFKFEFQI